MTRAEFNDAFRAVMSDEFAGVPACEGEIDYTFSTRFQHRMNKLIKAEKRRGWHWVNTAGKRAAIIAAALICVFSVALGIGYKASVQSDDTPTPPCVLKEENGKFYLQISYKYLEELDLVEITPPGIGAQIPAPRTTLKFSTVAGMKRAFETGDFTEENLIALANRAKNGKVEIPNPDKICDAVLPAGIERKGIWNNLTYYVMEISSNYNCKTENCHNDSFCVDLVGDYYESIFDDTIVNYADAAKTVISERAIEDRNAKEFIYTNDTGKYKQLLYQIESNGRVLHIMEFYVIEHYYTDSFHYMSETIPLRIKMFCKEEDVSWWVDLEAFEERPTVEWLASFGIQEVTG